MNKVFVRTKNVKKFVALMEEVKQLPANIPKIVPTFSEKYHGVSLTGSAQNKINIIKGYLDQGLYPIMRVKTTNGQHWVAVVGVTNNDVIMADPGSEKTNAFATYSLGECSTLNVYQIG